MSPLSTQYVKLGYSMVHSLRGLDIYHSETHDFICGVWDGKPSMDQVKLGCEALIRSAIEKDCWHLLNDQTRLRITIPELVSWIQTVFFPKFIKIGLKRAANVSPPVPEVLSNTNKVFEVEIPIDIQLFTSFSDATRWLVGEAVVPPYGHDTISLKTRDGLRQFSIGQILYFGRITGQTFIQTEHERIGISKTLSELEEIVSDDIFFRAHKSFILNLLTVDSLEYASGGYYKARFKAGDFMAGVSKSKIKELRAKLRTR